MKNQPTTDGLEILRRFREKDPELEALYQEELKRINIANKIRQARKKVGISQKELAKQVNTTQSAISRLESSDYERFSMNTLLKIATALNYDVQINLKPKRVG